MTAGRPTIYTDDLAAEICGLLAEGKSLRTICLAEHMPAKSSVFKWLRENQQFSDQYARAKEESADAMLEDMFDIADDDTTDVQRAKLRVDVRKWAASKLKPKKYGDKALGDKDNPIHTVSRVERVIVDGDATDQDS